MFDDVPPWVLWGVPIGIVILALVSSRDSGGGTSYGRITAYQPAPVDPAIAGIAQSEIAARTQAFTSVVGLFGAEEISRISANRDVTLEGIQADVSNRQTEAARQAALSQQDTLRFSSSNDARVQIEQARQASHIVDSQGATAKYVAKKQNNPINTLINGAAHVIGAIFGRH